MKKTKNSTSKHWLHQCLRHGKVNLVYAFLLPLKSSAYYAYTTRMRLPEVWKGIYKNDFLPLFSSFMVDVEGVTGPLASEGPSTTFPSRLVSLISAEVLSSFWGLYFLSFSFPPVSLIRNLSISLLPCLTGCLVASALCTLATTFFEVEDTGDMGGDSKANCNRRVLESHKKGKKRLETMMSN